MSPFGDGIADTRVGLIDAASREVLIGGDGGVSAVLQRDGRSCGRIALPSVEFAPSCERAAATVRIKGYLVNESSTISPGPASQVSFELSLIRAPGFYLRF